MKLQIIAVLLMAMISHSCTTPKKELTVFSPDQSVRLEFRVDSAGTPVYSVFKDEKQVLEPSVLGLKTSRVDLSKELQVASIAPVEKLTDDYSLLSDKKSKCHYEANRAVVKFETVDDIQLNITFQVSNDGVAFRYLLDGSADSIRTIQQENTTFNFPADAKAWLHPQAVAQAGWSNTQPSYEEYYQMEIPVGTPSTYGQGWSFPALFHSNGNWVLLSETDMGRKYCGSHLADQSPDGEYSIAFAQQKERTTPDAAVNPEGNLPIHSPWRMIEIGNSLGTIVESTMSTDLSTPSRLDDTSFVKNGKASWSWVLLKDDSTIYKVQKEFIDYAAEMHWQYCLVDALWDTQIGYDKIAELSKYAQSKGIGLILWYNSNGDWNKAPQMPRNKLFDPESRRKEFARIHDMGIKGVKIDFFGGDGQSFMNYYQDLLKDAAKCQLMVNFHGTTIPRGWTRTYPNLVTMEAVRGFEFITFEQSNADAEPTHCAMLPFARNAIGPMDFTPVCFSEIPNIKRVTRNGFELALSVIFQSGIQHIAEIPRGMAKQPDYVVDFMKQVPAHWDDVKFIDGYPGKYVALARKNGDKWYVAGINGQTKVQTVIVDLSQLGDYNGGTLISDGDTPREFTKTELEGSTLGIMMKPYGGFVFIPHKK